MMYVLRILRVLRRPLPLAGALRARLCTQACPERLLDLTTESPPASQPAAILWHAQSCDSFSAGYAPFSCLCQPMINRATPLFFSSLSRTFSLAGVVIAAHAVTKPTTLRSLGADHWSAAVFYQGLSPPEPLSTCFVLETQR